MRAKEMFEELNFIEAEPIHLGDIRYTSEDGMVIIEFRVGEWKNKTYTCYCSLSGGRISTDIKFHLAIHQQLKELGWVE